MQQLATAHLAYVEARFCDAASQSEALAPYL